MKSVGRKFLVATTTVLLAVAGGCSSDGDQPVDQSRRPGNAADGYPLERALVACIQDNGIDSELRPDGGGQALSVVATKHSVDVLGWFPVVEFAGHVVEAVLDERELYGVQVEVGSFGKPAS